MNYKHKLLGFTLIEMLVVLMIIGILLGIASLSYTNSKIQARNIQRKTDLANIQTALEMYRSNHQYGSYPATLNIACGSLGGLQYGGLTYLTNIPKDPFCTKRTYYYQSSPAGCDEGVTLVCNDYIIATALENYSGSCLANLCGLGVDCNYCIDSYGQPN